MDEILRATPGQAPPAPPLPAMPQLALSGSWQLPSMQRRGS
jgi:hypothetical protein